MKKIEEIKSLIKDIVKNIEQSGIDKLLDKNGQEALKCFKDVTND